MRAFINNSNPIKHFENHLGISLATEPYIILISVIGSLGGFAQGFIMTQSELMLSDDSFMSMMSNYDDTYVDKFTSIFYAGEMFGALLSFPLSENFGRRNTLLYAALTCSVMVLWSSMTSSAANLLSARLFTGWMLGITLATAPIYIAEVTTIQFSIFILLSGWLF